MNRKFQPTLEIILKYDYIISMRHWEELTEGRQPFGGNTVRQNARLYQSVELRLSCS